MRKLVASASVSLDGVMQGAGGPEDDPASNFAYGGWAFPYWDESLDLTERGFEGPGREIVLGQAPTLGPAPPGHLDVTGKDGPDQAPGHTSTGADPLDAHAGTLARWSLAAERGVDRAPSEDDRHPRPIVAGGVKVAVDGLALGRMRRGRRHGIGRSIRTRQGGLDGLGAVRDFADTRHGYACV